MADLLIHICIYTKVASEVPNLHIYKFAWYIIIKCIWIVKSGLCMSFLMEPLFPRCCCAFIFPKRYTEEKRTAKYWVLIDAAKPNNVQMSAYILFIVDIFFFNSGGKNSSFINWINWVVQFLFIYPVQNIAFTVSFFFISFPLAYQAYISFWSCFSSVICFLIHPCLISLMYSLQSFISAVAFFLLHLLIFF